jgi:aminoglycoside phosphotransferase (APT) family kinase protein
MENTLVSDGKPTNFIFPWTGEVVAVDWERLRVADPAADLRRLMAEVTHSIKQHVGSVAEALPFVQRLANAYSQALPDGTDVEALIERARFYQASSTLRIARNGWVSRLDRMGFVAQALALLSG